MKRLVAILLLVGASSVMATAPNTINYQGRLTTAAGVPVADDNYAMVFTIYYDSVITESLWTETRIVNVSGGLFSTLLGTLTSFPEDLFTNLNLWLGIRVGTDPEMTPRTRLASVPHARSVATVDGATGGEITTPLQLGAFNLLTGQWELAVGWANEISGQGSVAVGKHVNVDGDWSLGAGEESYINHNNCFLFNDAVAGGVATTAAGQFVANSGDVYLGRTGGNVTLSQSPGSGGINDNAGTINIHHLGGNSHFGWGTGDTYLSYSNQGQLQIRRYNGNGTYTDAINIPGSNAYVGLRGVGAPTNVLTLANAANAGGQGLANAWTTYSSRRWKTDIVTLDGALDKVRQLRGVYYRPLDDTGRQIGFIAEEVGEVLPEIVTYEENGVDARSMDYARLTAVLVEAVKEQSQTIKSLQAEVEMLKQEIRRATTPESPSRAAR